MNSDWIMIDTNECFQRDIYCNPMEMHDQLKTRINAPEVLKLMALDSIKVFWLCGVDTTHFHPDIYQIIVANRSGLKKIQFEF